MKTIKFLFIATIIFVSLSVHSQSRSDKMYDAFANKDGVTNFSFSKNMVDAIDIDLGDDGDEKQVTGDLHQVRFMSYNPKKGSLSGSEFTDKAIACLPKSSYRKYEGDDDDNDAEIWLMGSKRKFKECHIFTTSQQENQVRIVVSFYGDFTVNDIKGLKSKGKGFSDSSE